MTTLKLNHPGLKILFRVIFALMTLAVMAYIFYLSAESAVQSSQTSERLIEKIADTFVDSYKEMPVHEKEQFVSSLQDIVRKAAHFTVFGVLGVCASCFAATFKGKFLLKLIFCQLFCSLYAASDEYHQTFSDGRSCQLSDIGFDSLGSFCGIILVLLIVYIFVKFKCRGGEKVRKRDLIKQIDALKGKLLEADAYIKELTDIIADKDNELRVISQKNIKQAEEMPVHTEIEPESQEIAQDNIESSEQQCLPQSEYHDFDFADTAVPENRDDIETYAIKAISKIVTESVKVGCVLASSDNENKKELLNLTLGRTEVAKNEISSIVSSGLDADLIKASVDKECALVMEYYQSILAQL